MNLITMLKPTLKRLQKTFASNKMNTSVSISTYSMNISISIDNGQQNLSLPSSSKLFLLTSTGLFIVVSFSYYFRPGRGVKYCNKHVSLSVCLSVCLLVHLIKHTSKHYEIFCTVATALSCLPLMTMQYVVNYVMFSHNGVNGAKSKTSLLLIKFVRWRHW